MLGVMVASLPAAALPHPVIAEQVTSICHVARHSRVCADVLVESFALSLCAWFRVAHKHRLTRAAGVGAVQGRTRSACCTVA